MYSSTTDLSLRHTQACKRWLPLLVLLVALAQLSTAAHWHPDNHSVVDCGLCLQQGGNTALLGSHQIPVVAIGSPLRVASLEPTIPVSVQPYRTPIRAPPRAPVSYA